MDNCSAHGSHRTLPSLAHVTVKCLSPGTTSRLQPLDDGIIVALKMYYRTKQMQYAVDQLERNCTDIYKFDILQAIKWLITAWNDFSTEKICNCWGTSGIVLAYNCDTLEEERAVKQLKDFVRAAVPESWRVPVADILNWELEIVVAQHVLESDFVVKIMSAGEGESDSNGDAAAGTSGSNTSDTGSIAKQLDSLLKVKIILEELEDDNVAMISGLRRVQRMLRKQ